MSKADAFSEFRPSFVSVGYGWLPKLFEQAFFDGRPKIEAQLGTAGLYQSTGAVGAGGDRSIRFGHVRSIAPIGDDLSGAAPYLLLVEFDGDAIQQVKLTLNLLNLRVVVANDLFFPAKFNEGTDGRSSFEKLTLEPKPCGFAVLHEPDTLSPPKRFEHLREEIHDQVLAGSHPAGYLPFNEDTLVGRLDLSITWKPDTLGKISSDLFGFAIGTPGASVPDGLNAARLISPAVDEPFDSLVYRTGGFALDLPHDFVDGILVATGKAEGMSDKGTKLYAEAKRSFNLTDKFVGVLFEGVRIQWLDDFGRPIGKFHGGVGLTAFALDGKEDKLGNWYTTFQGEMNAAAKKPYLGMFSRLSISATLGDRDIYLFQLKSRFETPAVPFSWLDGRDAVISIGKDKWKDRFGDDQDGLSIGLSLEAAATGDVLARLNAKSLGIPPTSFAAIATSMTLAPIVLVDPPKAAEPNNLAAGGSRRGYFTRIRGDQPIAQLFATNLVGWFFKEAVEVEEIRVVGIGLGNQPRQINDPASNSDERETALLLDYETDFNITLGSPSTPDTLDLGTKRVVTARVDGSGISFSDGAFSWVQVPRGLHDLQLADPGLWKLGALGKILKVVELSIRRDPVKHLAIRLHLTGDLGILTASDFVFTVDLESGSAAIQSFPSEVRIEKADVFKATGKLHIDKVNGVEDIRGSLDVALTAMGWRGYAGLRIRNISDRQGGMTKASVGSMRLEWPTMIPVFGTGIGVKSLEGLLATHFERTLPAATPAVPPDLAWLEKAGGNVETSIESLNLWNPRLGASTVGLGVGLGLMTNPKIANFNAMLAIEEPGPQVLLFAKLNLFKDLKPNDEEPQSLGKGVLGLVKIDTAYSQIVFAALADLEYSSLAHVRAPIEIAANWKRLSAWHVFLGHFDEPITATLKIKDIATLTAQGWIMAAGDEIQGAPVAPNVRTTLPGLALSLGYRVAAQIGPDYLCVRGALATYISASFSHVLFLSGSMAISGELRLFIVTIGASGTFQTQYLKSEVDNYSGLFISGEICGKYESFFFTISGCVRLMLGSPIEDPTTPPPLVKGVRLVAGGSVALFGQGQTAPIDAVLGNATEDLAKAATGIELDCVITLDLEAPPRVALGGGGFLAHLPRPYENMRLHLGAREGHYLLKQVLLEREVSAGVWQAVDYDACPARWWHPHSPPTGDQPVPTTLALLTRAPLSTPNALIDPDQLKTWLEALLGDICATSLLPQRCCYMLAPKDRGSPPAGQWALRAELPSSEIERRIGRTGATASPLVVTPRPGAGESDDPLPGYPAYPAICRVLPDSATGAGVAFLEHRAQLIGRVWVNGIISLTGPMLAGDPMLLLVAYFSTIWQYGARVLVTTTSGPPLHAELSDLSLEELSTPGVLQRFHQDHLSWKAQAEGFARLAEIPNYAGFRFALAKVDFAAMGVDANDLVERVELYLPTVDGKIAQDLAVSLLVGGYRFTPAAEQQRFEHDEAARTANVNDLNDYLTGKRVPLLEPNSSYRIVTECDVVSGGTETVKHAFNFHTACFPPKSADAYLLSIFPQDRESDHFATEHPGFCLASADALQILAKFPTSRLMITINEDNGAPVLDPSGKLQWHRGISYIPKDIFPDDITQGNPKGLIVESVASLPTTLREALCRYIKANGMDCLAPIQLPPGALWIGLDVVLRPLSSYKIVVALLGPGDAPIFPDDPPFLSWEFKTALAPSLSAHAEQLRAARPRHRTLVQPIARMPALAHEHDVAIVADKVLEEALAVGTGERILHSGEAQLSVLWERVPSLSSHLAKADVLRAAAIVLTSNEPLLRRTRGVRIEERAGTTSPSKVRIAVPADLPCVMPSLTRSPRVARIEVASSGRMLVAHLAPGSGPAGIALERLPIDRIASGIASIETVTIAAAVLADRPIPT